MSVLFALLVHAHCQTNKLDIKLKYTTETLTLTFESNVVEIKAPT